MHCYICGQPATSVEHAPAKSFFPIEHRKNLITVSSCALHNENTSKDDEYVRNVIVMSITNNPESFAHFNSKVVGSFLHSPKLFNAILQEMQDVVVHDLQTGSLEKSKMLKIDRVRINFIMRKIAYAVYYNKFKTIWNRGLEILTDHLLYEDFSLDEHGEIVREMRDALPNITFEGENPEIFQYCFIDKDIPDLNNKVLIMKFYNGMEFWAYPKTDSFGSFLE